ncbi:hypothetical protein AB0M02_46300 [Actinoplanes sp. NPDC051861]|uniref:hypothetical protein n=1 Tax=Actinoplanes sp. NPDC051861 TaxID=3155170 RepID=UPI00341E97AE
MPTDAPPPSHTAATHSVLENLGLLVTPIAVFSALLYFFAWIRADAFFGYFGVDTHLIGYSSNDYLLRSGGLAFQQMSWLMFTVVLLYLALWAGQLVIRRHPRLRWPLAVSCGCWGALLSALGFLVALGVDLVTPLRAALALMCGAMLVELGVSWGAAPAGQPAPVLLRRVIVAGVVLTGAFWASSLHARHDGHRDARRLAENLRERPAVVLYSTTDQRLLAPGVKRALLPKPAEFRYRYEGLRLLVFSPKRWILLPESWRPGQSPAMIVPRSDAVRVDLTTSVLVVGGPGGAQERAAHRERPQHTE